eukprot:1477286-Pyramimonas_sp.AAC.1
MFRTLLTRPCPLCPCAPSEGVATWGGRRACLDCPSEVSAAGLAGSGLFRFCLSDSQVRSCSITIETYGGTKFVWNPTNIRGASLRALAAKLKESFRRAGGLLGKRDRPANPERNIEM